LVCTQWNGIYNAQIPEEEKCLYVFGAMWLSAVTIITDHKVMPSLGSDVYHHWAVVRTDVICQTVAWDDVITGQ